MELFANDLSIHKQFRDLSSFCKALRGLMAMRKSARRFRREIYCHRALSMTEPLPGVPMQKALGRLLESEQRATMSWLARASTCRHSSDEWLECQGEMVTDTAVGEAAYRKLQSVGCGLVSVTPSDWNHSPIEVTWRREAERLEDRNMEVENWWDIAVLENKLKIVPLPLRTWDDLQTVLINRYPRLTFANDCFEPLSGIPFAKSSMERILKLFDILDQLASGFDAAGNRTPEGHRIYKDFFTGKNALFSDSTDSEKSDFRNDLTFKHPSDTKKSLFCPWHGKERHGVLRLHFSWPIRFGKPVYIVYIGPKITKQ